MELQVCGARWEMETVVDGERGTPVEIRVDVWLFSGVPQGCSAKGTDWGVVVYR